MVSLDWQHGDFFGTLEQGRTLNWSAYHRERHLHYGHGKYLLDEKGIHFHLMHGGETFIPYGLMQKVELVKRHGGKFTVGNFITKVTWVNGEHTLESGFVFAKDDAVNAGILQMIKSKLRG